jgi:1-acyl-sn-glycerol-3-phosphate acyltransferase
MLALLFLCLIVAAPCVWFVLSFRAKSYSLLQWWLWFSALVLVRVLWRAKLPRQMPLKPGQGAVFVCNHRSSVDPFFFQVCCSRAMHWMVAREFCEQPAFAWFLRAVEVIPVNRGGIDTAAMKAAIRYCQEGDWVGMFPEGRLNVTEQFLLPVRPGAVRVALRAQVPIVPCYLEGAPFRTQPWSPFLMPARVTLKVGVPLDLSAYYEREHDEQLVQEIMNLVVHEMARLSGRTGFQPTFAGRHWKPTVEQVEADMKAHARRQHQRVR